MRDIHHVGAKPLPLPRSVTSRAVYGGPADCYRYRMEWTLYPNCHPSEERTMMWLWMNPSVAGHECADRTALKGWQFARTWGYSRMLVGNSMAYRATDQARLAIVPDPIGPENERHLLEMAAEADLIVVGYGRPKCRILSGVGPRAASLLTVAGHYLHALRVSPDGTPHHPLYLPMDLMPEPWWCRSRTTAVR